MLRRAVLIVVIFAFFTVPALADMISFVDPLAGVDDTTGWSTNDDQVGPLAHSYNLLGSTATVAAFENVTEKFLSHRLTRGLGVWGGEDDEVDKIGGDEHIDILFSTNPYYISEIEIRSLFDPDTDKNEEWAAIAFWKDGSLVQTEYLVGNEDLGTVGTDGDASWSGTPILVDKLVFYVPTIEELQDAYKIGSCHNYNPSLSEFAVAELTVNPVPVPGAILLGMIGLSVAGVKLRKFA
ncbi:MAG: hypothetical protein H8D56_03060 [Planctomycetes bacterium]|nr:hypothetical protein [Planctomycetota bacterium]